MLSEISAYCHSGANSGTLPLVILFGEKNRLALIMN